MVFPFAIHTHTPCLCECMAILSPNPLLWNRMVFPFALRHTHTHQVSVYVWHSLSAHALLLSLRSCHVLLYFNKCWTSWCILPAPPPAVEQEIPAAVLWFSNCARGPGRKENPPPPFCGTGGPSRYGLRHACSGSPPGLEASGPCIWGGGIPLGHWGERGGGENAQRTTI